MSGKISVYLLWMSFSGLRKRLMVDTEHTEHLTKNLTIRHDNRLHGVILRLKAVMTVFLVKTLYRGLVAHQSHHNIAVDRRGRFMDNHHILVENTGIDHAGAADPQGKKLARLIAAAGVGDIVLHLFYRQNRLTGRYLAEQRYPRHALSRQPDRPMPFLPSECPSIQGSYHTAAGSPGSPFSPLKNPLSLFSIKSSATVFAGSGADFPHGGRQAILRAFLQKGQDLLLFFV